MKRLGCLLAMITLLVGLVLGGQPNAYAGSLGLATWSVPSLLATEALKNKADAKLADSFGDKIDLNNTPARLFRQYPGLYPTLAKIIIKNAPYDKVEDVLKIAGLTDRQKEILQDNLKNFTVSPPENTIIEGDNRLNDGVYD